MKIITIIGARPQFIKAAAISRELLKHKNITEIIIHTGQHYDDNMSEIFFNQMKIPMPKYNLKIGGGTHGQMTGRQIEKIEEILINENPNLVIVYGDTNSTLAGALAAVKLNIKVAHIEAGLRSFNRNMPEEINRIITDHISTFLFAPTQISVENLIKEGFNVSKIYKTGDIMLDACIYYKTYSKKPNLISDSITDFNLCTIHRAENTDNIENLTKIFKGLSYSNKVIILPIHPRTKKIITESKIEISKNILLLDPVGYFEMLWLELNADKIITDSGGVQKEAYFFKKFCITLRNETEWMELVHGGWNVLVGSNTNLIKEFINKESPNLPYINYYGTGNTSTDIVNKIICEF